MDASQVIIKNNARVVFAGYQILQEAITRGYLVPRGSTGGTIPLTAISQGSTYVTPQELQTIINSVFSPISQSIPIQPNVATGTPIFFRFNAQRTGQFPYFASSVEPALNWTTTLSGLFGFNTTPIIGLTGLLYSAAGPTLYALKESDGSIVWSYTNQAPSFTIFSQPAFSSVETIIGCSSVSLDSSQVFCLNSLTGAQIWSVEIGGTSPTSPVINSSGVILILTSIALYYMSPTTGAVIYSDGRFAGSFSYPSLGLDDTLYINTGFSLFAVNTNTRDLKWEVPMPTGQTFRTIPVIGPTGRIYIGSQRNGLFIYDLSGSLIYNHSSQSNIYNEVTVGYDDTCFMLIQPRRGEGFPILEALDRTNNVLWSISLPSSFRGGENTCLGGDGYLYISQGITAYCYNSGTGQLVWSYQISGVSFVQPSIGTLGNLYFLTGGSITSLISRGSLIPWGMFGNTRAHGGLTVNSGPSTTIQKRWEVTAPANISCPAIQGPDGTVYVGTINGFLRAYSPLTGSLQWSVSVAGEIRESCAVDANGVIYASTTNGSLTAVSRQGAILWKYTITISSAGLTSPPTIGSDGTIFIASQGPDSSVYAINPNGTLKWRRNTGFSHSSTSVAIANDGSLYVTANDGFVIALNSDGTTKWNTRVNGPSVCAPSIAFDGTIYVTSSSLEALNPNGTQKWRYSVSGGQLRSSPAITPLGYIIFYTQSGILYCVNPNGTLRWSFSSGTNTIASTVCIGNDGSIYYAQGSTLRRLAEDNGAVSLVTNLGANATNQPIIGLNRYLYVPTGTKLLAYSA